MLQPKRVKFRRVHKMKMKGIAYKGSQLSFGSFGLKSLDECWITDRQIEAARIALTRNMKREGKYGLTYFQINQSLKNQLKYVWVKVKVH